MQTELTLVRKTPEQEVVEHLHDYAAACRANHQWPSCLTALRRALAIDPGNARCWATLGCSLWNMGRFDEALAPMEKSLELAPECGEHWGNYGLLLHSLRRYDDAETAYDKADQYAKDEKDRMGVIWDRCQMHLEQGMWEQGLKDYEIRIEKVGAPLYPGMPIPIWKGEPLDGKTLYIQAEQGLGDRILLSRYFTVIKDRWPTCKIKACFNEKLADLFWEFRHIVEFCPTGVPWPDDLDYGCYAASLPGIFGTTPETVPADPGILLKRVKQQQALKSFVLPQPRLKALKVGIAWTGNPEMTRNDMRSIPLELLIPLNENPEVVLYGFQVGAGSQDVDRLMANDLVCNLGPEFDKYGPVTAGVAMLEMDLMITVCTATAHLAGALGVPCWTLLCWDPYWIWLQGKESRHDTPWYPNMRLIRQSTPGDWTSVIKQVEADLKDYSPSTIGD